MNKKKVVFFSRLIISIALIFALFKLVPYNELVEILKKSNKWYLLLTFLIYFLGVLIGVGRWQFVLGALGVRITYKESFLSVFSSFFFNLFFPSFVAGDVFRGFSISQKHGGVSKVASSVLMDRFSGAIALSTVALFSYMIGRKIFTQSGVGFALLTLCVIVGCAALVIFSKRFFNLLIGILKEGSKLREKIVGFHDQLYFFRVHPKVFAKSLLYSLAIQLLTPLSFFVSSKAFGLEIPAIIFFILVPIIMAIALIPITIVGAGTREAAAVGFFSMIGIDKSVGLSMSLLNLTALILLGIIGGIIYVALYHRWFQSDT